MASDPRLRGDDGRERNESDDLAQSALLQVAQALAILQDAGAEIEVIEYLKTPPTAEELARLYDRANLTPREGLRQAEPGAKAMTDADDAAILAAMAADPILIERPLVETEKGVVIARPPEKVRGFL